MPSASLKPRPCRRRIFRSRTRIALSSFESTASHVAGRSPQPPCYSQAAMFQRRLKLVSPPHTIHPRPAAFGRSSPKFSKKCVTKHKNTPDAHPGPMSSIPSQRPKSPSPTAKPLWINPADGPCGSAPSPRTTSSPGSTELSFPPHWTSAPALLPLECPVSSRSANLPRRS
jgi:hypothetical protein